MLLVVDNGSVYTDYIIMSLDGMGISHSRVTFDRITQQDIEGSSSIILSGRRQNDSMMNATNSRLVRYVLHEKKPLLGICYGAEILAITLGGTIRKMAQPRRGLVEATVTRENALCSGTIRVFESHSYLVSALDPGFETLASSEGCPHEAFRYGTKNVFGTQFHPEMSDDGKQVLKNFASIT